METVEIGYISKTHGLKGHVILRLNEYINIDEETIKSVFLDINGSQVPYFIEECRPNNTGYIIKLETIDTVDTSKKLIGKKAFTLQLENMLLRLALLNLPVIAEIGGNAYAGGAILASACDFRFMRSDRGRFCFPEVHLGIPFIRFIATESSEASSRLTTLGLVISPFFSTTNCMTTTPSILLFFASSGYFKLRSMYLLKYFIPPGYSGIVSTLE
jgi:ribosomal protein L35AE/L33A